MHSAPPPPKPRKRHPPPSETDESLSIDAAIDVVHKSQSSIIVSLPSTGSFESLIQRVEETMALGDKRGISLAHKAKRRTSIAQKLNERGCGSVTRDRIRLAGSGVNSTSHALSMEEVTTKRSTDRIRKHLFVPPPPKPKQYPTTKKYSGILLSMIYESEASRHNPTTMTPSQKTEQISEPGPETLVVEKTYPPLGIKIVQVPGRAGGYVIAKCRNSNWMLELGVRLEREERASMKRVTEKKVTEGEETERENENEKQDGIFEVVAESDGSN
ncbi:hypothetical protein V490_06926 [Pseudogymnoascus sp. VKM F-3557]|nr:hypothetical protein V490_06926 [Pseudogymnoascus sp. VKM F-3557]